ncbi:MAG: glutamate cyclase domain-containing protein [Planctomycetaceae bacterium]
MGVGQLAGAARELASHARRVAIVTGFFIPHAQPPAGETDGPPGTLFLAHCLQALGIETAVITDAPCARAVQAAATGIGFPIDRVLVFPLSAEAWFDEFWDSDFANGLTHLMAIERVGPSHSAESVLKQRPEDLPDFLSEVAAEHHNHCHNMRGVCIDAHTAPLHLLFERLPNIHPTARTIGIGDGGNEIGMGTIAWAELRRRLSGEQAGRVPCRIACDFNIVAGTSNWGAMALAASVCLLHNRLDVLKPWTRERHRECLEQLVANGPAVDGVTGRREATVDGLPFLTYIQPWEGILRCLFEAVKI